jgi:cobalt/nickel transport protein
VKTTVKLWIGIGILALLSPLGLLLPERFKAGPAWGEWDLGNRLSRLWSAPIPDYAFKGWEAKGMPCLSLAYMICAGIGILVTALIVLWIAKLLVKKGS